MIPANNAMGYFNLATREWHQEKGHKKECNLDEATNTIKLSWGKAKDHGADLCGHEFPDLSQRNDSKKTSKKKIDTVA